MKITVFLEGRPGHEKQSMAIALALKELTAAEIRQVQVTVSGISGHVAGLCRLLLLPQGGCETACGETDLLLGTGSKTHVALLACKKKYGIPAVTCMAPEPYLRPWFDLCCIPRHDGVDAAPNIFFTDGPPVMSGPQLIRDPGCGLILIGGEDSRSHVWDETNVVACIRDTVESRGDIHWRVSSSPRTPETTVQMVRELAACRANVDFFHFRDTPRGWVEEQYARATYAVVTADSVSMIYEAVTAGCKVGVLPVQWQNSSNKFKTSLAYLEKGQLIVPYGADFGRQLEECTAGRFNEARRCAEEIVHRFFR